MTVFLDYWAQDGKVVALSILDELDLFHDFIEEFQNATELLIEPGWIVVFDRTQAPLLRLYENNPILEEYGRFKGRWLDLRLFLRERTGLFPAISKMALGTIGESARGSIQDIERVDWSSKDALNIVDKLHDRLAVLKRCLETAQQTGELSFYYKGQLHDADFDLTEPGHPMSID